MPEEMSILDAAYRLCKSVKESPLRDEAGNLILGLNFNERGTFGLYARQRQSQVLGYLAVDQERPELERKRGQTLPPLEDDERRLLADVHRQVVELNRRCIAPLLDALPKCVRAVDPYVETKYVQQPVDAGRELFEMEAAGSLVASFHRHPAIVAALETTGSLGRELSEDHYRGDVGALHHILMEDGPLKGRRRLHRHLRLVFATSVKGHLGHMGALVCVRDSLANLNQLLFQALLMDKLIIFDEENTVDVGVRIAHTGGFGVGLVCQQVRHTILEDFMTDVGTIVLLKGTMLEEPRNVPFRIETLLEETSREAGTVKQCELRLIDENMNSFYPLLRR